MEIDRTEVRVSSRLERVNELADSFREPHNVLAAVQDPSAYLLTSVVRVARELFGLAANHVHVVANIVPRDAVQQQ